MSVVVLQVFVSLLLVAGSLVLFLHTVRARDLDHADRLSLAPLDDDTTANLTPTPPTPTPTPTPTTAPETSSCKQDRSNTTTP